MSEVPKTLCNGRYLVGEVLGAGGMATVYRCHDQLLDVERAVKVLSAARSVDKKSRTRFVDEARMMAKLTHPGIVTVFDVVEDQGLVFMIMELIEGGNLARRVELYKALTPIMAVTVMLEVLEALGVAHKADVVHRDVKPHNILLTADGVSKVSDFGIARLANRGDSLTKTGASIGTWAYMAPEQRHTSSNIDCRADVYGAGTTFYALLTALEPVDLFAAQLNSERFECVHPLLREVVCKATRYEADERFSSVEEFIAALQSVLPNLPADPENTVALPGLLLLDHPLGDDDSVKQQGQKRDDKYAGADALDRHGVRGKSGGVGSNALVFGAFSGLLVGLLLLALIAFFVLRTFGSEDAGDDVAVADIVTSNDIPKLERSPSEPVREVPVPPPAQETVNPSKPDPLPVIEPTPPQPSPAVKLGRGGAVVNSIPWSKVSLDGEGVGNSSKRYELTEGVHQLYLESEDGRTYKKSLVIRPKEDTHICWNFDLESPCL